MMKVVEKTKDHRAIDRLLLLLDGGGAASYRRSSCSCSRDVSRDDVQESATVQRSRDRLFKFLQSTHAEKETAAKPFCRSGNKRNARKSESMTALPLPRDVFTLSSLFTMSSDDFFQTFEAPKPPAARKAPPPPPPQRGPASGTRPAVRPAGSSAAAAAASRTTTTASGSSAAMATTTTYSAAKPRPAASAAVRRPSVGATHLPHAQSQSTSQQQQQQQPSFYAAQPAVFTPSTSSQRANRNSVSHYTQQPQQQQQQQPYVAASSKDFGWTDMSATANFSGAMDNNNTNNMAAIASTNTSSSNMAPTTAPSYFTPNLISSSTSTGNMSSASLSSYPPVEADEPPLLEELGINLDHILLKTKAVVVPFANSQLWRKYSSSLKKKKIPGTPPIQQQQHQQQPEDTASLIINDADLAGPLVFALLLGAELILTGKLDSFAYIYGLSVFGCCGLTLILNLLKEDDSSSYPSSSSMSPQTSSISIWTTTSILGYALLPVNVLAGIKILYMLLFLKSSLSNSSSSNSSSSSGLSTTFLGQFLGVLAVLWSTTASTRLLEVGCNMKHQRYLIAYPIALLYSAFVLMTIF